MSALVDHGEADFIFAPADLEDGISHFITVDRVQRKYAIRKKINLDLTSEDQEGKPIPVDMSPAVYRLDLRTLLYWSPEIKTNEQGKEHIRFYMSGQRIIYLTYKTYI